MKGASVESSVDELNEVGKAQAKDQKQRRKKLKKSNDIESLKIAAGRIADMLCELSAERDFFVSEADERPEKRIDTKTLKEFSGVIKEMSAVLCGLGEIGNSEKEALRIEFSEDAFELSK